MRRMRPPNASPAKAAALMAMDRQYYPCVSQEVAVFPPRRID
jgi:hypothetical protein